jgi:hypothetical protein
MLLSALFALSKNTPCWSPQSQGKIEDGFF